MTSEIWRRLPRLEGHAAQHVQAAAPQWARQDRNHPKGAHNEHADDPEASRDRPDVAGTPLGSRDKAFPLSAMPGAEKSFRVLCRAAR